jgi:hypothetical protein
VCRILGVLSLAKRYGATKCRSRGDAVVSIVAELTGLIKKNIRIPPAAKQRLSTCWGWDCVPSRVYLKLTPGVERRSKSV